MTFPRKFVIPAALLLTLAVYFTGASAGDRNALWKIVHDQCVVHQGQGAAPAPCEALDLRDGAGGGFAILKDRVGTAQYLLIPTARVSGIESPDLLAAGATNYWVAAWDERHLLDQRLDRALGRDDVGLAVNSMVGRTQDQLHIHIDCIRPDVKAALGSLGSAIGTQWSPLPAKLRGHSYWAMRVAGGELGASNPFALLADGMPSAKAEMGLRTLVVTGGRFADGDEGFYVLTDRVDETTGDRASGEELLDHDCQVVLPPR